MVVDKQFSLRRLRAVMAPEEPAPRQPEPTAEDRRGTPRRQPEDLQHEQGIARSIDSIERALVNISSLHENMTFYKELSGDLRRCLDDERLQRSEAQKRSGELQSLLMSERERVVLAEERQAAAAATIDDLREQLAAMQTETRRLVIEVQSLSAVRFDDGATQELRDRLAA